MTLDQIKLIKETHMMDDGTNNTLGAYVKIALDGGIDFVTSKDCVIFDDDNLLIHCICINEDLKGQANYPVKIISANYDIVQQIESVYSQENFEKMLDEGFLSSISQERKDFMIKWTKNVRNHALAPMDPDMYYKQEALIIPGKTKVMPRDDGFNIPVKPASLVEPFQEKITVVNEQSEFASAIASADKIMLGNDMEIAENIIVEAGMSKTIDLNGKKLTVTQDEDGKSLYAIINKGHLLLTNGTITARGVQNYEGGTLIVDGATIESCDETGGSAIWVFGGDVLVRSGTFTAMNGDSSDAAKCPCCLYNDGGNVTIDGGTFTTNSYAYAILNNNGTLIINDATVNGSRGGICVYRGTVTVNGGSFRGDIYYALYVETGDAIVNGGTYTGATSDIYVENGVNFSYSNIEITDSYAGASGTHYNTSK